MKPNPTNNATSTRLEEFFYLSFNFVATIAVTLINKYCFDKVEFGFPGALCNIHFAVTWLGCEMLRRMKFFEKLPNPPSPFEDRNYAAIIVVVGLVTPLNNTSLKHNSLGFYQLFKLLGNRSVMASVLFYALHFCNIYVCFLDMDYDMPRDFNVYVLCFMSCVSHTMRGRVGVSAGRKDSFSSALLGSRRGVFLRASLVSG
jgi:hypothetical protein